MSPQLCTQPPDTVQMLVFIIYVINISHGVLRFFVSVHSKFTFLAYARHFWSPPRTTLHFSHSFSSLTTCFYYLPLPMHCRCRRSGTQRYMVSEFRKGACPKCSDTVYRGRDFAAIFRSSSDVSVVSGTLQRVAVIKCTPFFSDTGRVV